MKIKSIFTAVCCVFFALMLVIHVNADDEYDFTDEMYEEQLENSGAGQLFNNLPSEAKRQMESLDLGSLSPNALLALTPAEFFKVITAELKDFVKSPFKLLCSLTAVILLTVLIKGLKETGSQDALPDVFTVISCLSVTGLLVTPIVRCIEVSLQAVENSSNFMISFIPVISGLMCVSGRPASGGVYYAVLFGAAQIASGLFKSVVVPLICVYLGLSMTSSVSQNTNIETAAKQIKTAASWILGFVVTVFVGLLTIQGIVASSGDTLAVKAGKFMIGSFVPVAGGALADAITAVGGCLTLVKNTVGSFGVIAAVLMILPILIQLFLWVLAINAAILVSDAFSIKEASGILRAFSSALSLLLTVLLCYGLLITVSTGIILVITTVSG